MLECGLQSRLGLEFTGFSIWYFLKLVVRGFLIDVLYVVCTQLHPGRLSVRVGDYSRLNEKIVTNLELRHSMRLLLLLLSSSSSSSSSSLSSSSSSSSSSSLLLLNQLLLLLLVLLLLLLLLQLLLLLALFFSHY